MLASGHRIFLPQRTQRTATAKAFFTAESAAAAENVNGNGIYRRERKERRELQTQSS
jgi:hypothetical protein